MVRLVTTCSKAVFMVILHGDGYGSPVFLVHGICIKHWKDDAIFQD